MTVSFTGSPAAMQVGNRTSPGVKGAPPVIADVASPPAASSAPPAPAAQPSSEQLRAATQALQKAVQKTAPGLEFSIDDDLGVTVVKLVDSQTKEVLRQFPSEEMLHISKSIEKMQGLLVHKVV